LRRSLVIDDGVNKKVMNLTAKMIKETGQSWSVSNIISSLLIIALKQDVTVDKVIKVQEELGKQVV